MRPSLDVFLLNVGQGDASVLLLPDDRAVVFDCADDHVLRKTLDAWSVRRIAAFVVSHLDIDHIRGAAQFLRGWPHPIETVYIGWDRSIGASEGERGAKELIDLIGDGESQDPSGQRRWETRVNTRAQLASGTGWAVDILAPRWRECLERERSEDGGEPNRWSAVLRIEAGGNTVLIGGDAPLLTWSEIDANERTANVFRIPHHGGALDDGGIPDGWDVARLYREAAATTAIVSVGTHNSHGHPNRNGSHLSLMAPAG